MKLFRQLRSLFRKDKLDAEMTAEMQAHLEMQVERHRAAGMDLDEARYTAQRQFGNVARVQEQCREQRGWLWLENFWRDLNFAARSLRRTPVFSLTVIATFALCLGPNTAILTTLYTLVLKPQPFHESGQIVRVYNALDKLPGSRSRQESSTPQYRDFKAGADLFSDFAVMRYVGSTLESEGPAERVFGMRVNVGFFDFFGVKPVLGRFATAEEDVVGRDRVLVLAQRFWETRFQSDPGVIGRVVRIGGEPFTIIGVAPRSVEVLDIHTQFFKPLESLANEEDPAARYSGKVVLFGRLKRDVSRTAALDQLNAIEQRFADEKATPGQRNLHEKAGHRVALESLGRQTADNVGKPLSLLQAGAGLVLLIGAVNVLNLMLARANTRRPELAIRLALGASRGTLLRQLLAESLLLTLIATAGGVALAFAALKVINVYLQSMLLTASPIVLEPTAIGAVVLLSLGLGTAVGALPLGLLARRGLKLAESRTASAGAGMRVAGNFLVMAQVATALVLLVGAGLLVRSFVRVVSTDPGFDAARIVQGRVVAAQGYEDPAKLAAFLPRLLAALREIPGVEKVAFVPDVSVGNLRTLPFVLRASPAASEGNAALGNLTWVTPDFFDTMNIRLLEGRLFTDTDDLQHAPVVIVDDLFARRHFPGRSAVGEEMNLGAASPPAGAPWPRIVGVVKRAQLGGLEGRDGMPFIYVPFVQQPTPGITFIVRSSRPTADVLAAIRLKIREVDPRLPLYQTASLQGLLDDALRQRRVLMTLITLFAGLALVLAGVGLYGVLAYDVSQRTREIGIRGAIGASRAQIVGLVVRQGLWKAGAGLGAGMVGAIFLTRFIRHQLFDVTATDPVTFAAVSLLLLLVALIACWLPARRAAKVDPVVALRAE
jgi:putative ABC transport system permease protein